MRRVIPRWRSVFRGRIRRRQHSNLPHNGCRIVKIQISGDSPLIQIDDAHPVHSEPLASLIDALICPAENPLDNTAFALDRTLQKLEFHVGNSFEEKGGELAKFSRAM